MSKNKPRRWKKKQHGKGRETTRKRHKRNQENRQKRGKGNQSQSEGGRGPVGVSKKKQQRRKERQRRNRRRRLAAEERQGSGEEPATKPDARLTGGGGSPATSSRDLGVLQPEQPFNEWVEENFFGRSPAGQGQAPAEPEEAPRLMLPGHELSWGQSLRDQGWSLQRPGWFRNRQSGHQERVVVPRNEAAHDEMVNWRHEQLRLGRDRERERLQALGVSGTELDRRVDGWSRNAEAKLRELGVPDKPQAEAWQERWRAAHRETERTLSRKGIDRNSLRGKDLRQKEAQRFVDQNPVPESLLDPTDPRVSQEFLDDLMPKQAPVSGGRARGRAERPRPRHRQDPVIGPRGEGSENRTVDIPIPAGLARWARARRRGRNEGQPLEGTGAGRAKGLEGTPSGSPGPSADRPSADEAFTWLRDLNSTRRLGEIWADNRRKEGWRGFLSWGRNPMPKGTSRNCPLMALSVWNKLNGRKGTGVPLNAGVYQSDFEQFFQTPFQRIENPKEILDTIGKGGHGSNGIVSGINERGIGHTINVANKEGHVYFLDGQTGREADISNLDDLYFMRTDQTKQYGEGKIADLDALLSLGIPKATVKGGSGSAFERPKGQPYDRRVLGSGKGGAGFHSENAKDQPYSRSVLAPGFLDFAKPGVNGKVSGGGSNKEKIAEIDEEIKNHRKATEERRSPNDARLKSTWELEGERRAAEFEDTTANSISSMGMDVVRQPGRDDVERTLDREFVNAGRNPDMVVVPLDDRGNQDWSRSVVVDDVSPGLPKWRKDEFEGMDQQTYVDKACKAVKGRIDKKIKERQACRFNVDVTSVPTDVDTIATYLDANMSSKAKEAHIWVDGEIVRSIVRPDAGGAPSGE